MSLDKSLIVGRIVKNSKTNKETPKQHKLGEQKKTNTPTSSRCFFFSNQSPAPLTLAVCNESHGERTHAGDPPRKSGGPEPDENSTWFFP